jgi:hypothetical protein
VAPGNYFDADPFPKKISYGGGIMKFIIGALGAVALLIGVAAAQPASARCFWNGVAMECYHHHPFFHHHWWHHEYWHRDYAPYESAAPRVETPAVPGRRRLVIVV